MKPWQKTLLTFLAGVVATVLVVLRMKAIQDEAARKAGSASANSITAEYNAEIARITKEVKNATKQQIIDGFMSRFSRPIPPDQPKP